MILVYGDDSADEQRQRVCAVAVVAGGEQNWRELESSWIARTGGIPFHANDCESDQGDFAQFTHEQNKALYRDLATMLAASDISGLGVAIDLIAQRKVFPDSPDLAYFKAFTESLSAVCKLCAAQKMMAECLFDISSENEYNAGFLYGSFREHDSEFSHYLAPKISFGHWRDNPRLQVADMIAFESMKALDHEVGPIKRIRRSWQVLRGTGKFDADGYSDEWFQSLKTNMSELEHRVGFNQSDYEKWLRDKNRQHSTSNLFHFSDWVARRDKNKGV